MVGVDDQDGDGGFEERMDRLPKLAGGLHCDMGDGEAGQPVREVEKVPSHGPEGADVALKYAVGPWGEATDDNGLLVDIEASTMRVENIHAAAPCVVAGWQDTRERRLSSACFSAGAEYHNVLCQRVSGSGSLPGSWHQ